ncbi:MAG: hypothetical protein NTW67_05725 [Candidatus Woesearchaeota archaeon]|nr:hypothetical protein [Candidatus Woesearchaeota archaeon]
MPQEAITEIDMDVYSRRIGPYFSWIESKIEGGWTQSESVQKDVLKEAKYLATTMRARFILGVSKGDFSKEVQRTLELFELSLDAFPEESDEVEAKIRHFVKGVSEELGAEFIPASYREPLTPQPPMPDPYPGPEPMPGPEPLEPDEPDEETIKTKLVKTEPVKKIKIEKKVRRAKIEIETPKAVKAKQAKTPKPKIQETKREKRGKGFFLVRWAKEFIFGED